MKDEKEKGFSLKLIVKKWLGSIKSDREDMCRRLQEKGKHFS